jgi:hypothetical protein
MPIEGEKSLRFKQRQERMRRIAEQNKPRRVRVLPKNDVIRRDIVHPTNKLAFPPQGGSVEWPLDQFTMRRIRDGDVTVEEEKKEEKPAPAPEPTRRPSRTYTPTS